MTPAMNIQEMLKTNQKISLSERLEEITLQQISTNEQFRLNQADIFSNLKTLLDNELRLESKFI
jgi:hypothetical protein